ncbi:MAG: alanine dehydrogenase [Acidimicrobiales bacterium]|nr:alanine dehydrogenase [Acidimicrobiales bacterium]
MSVRVGVAREIKSDEDRVAMTPDGVRELTHAGVEVLVEAGAGAESSFPDELYRAAGASVVDDAGELWERSTLVCKVKEPQPEEFGHLRPDLTLITYLHLAAYPQVAEALIDSGCTAIAYETVEEPDGSLPLLAPMSEIAGRMAVQIAAHLLEAPNGGRGVLLGGAPGVEPARVVIVGAGNVGWNAAVIATGMEAEVRLLDIDIDRLRWADQNSRGRIMTLASNRGALERTVSEADVVIGAVLVPGGRAPVLITDDMVRAMKPGSVVIDVAVDQGGCVETIHETSHGDPTYEVHGVVHYGVGNIPGAVPNTSTRALTNSTLPYIARLARNGPESAVGGDPALASGVNVRAGAVTNAAVAEALGRPVQPLAPT